MWKSALCAKPASFNSDVHHLLLESFFKDEYIVN